MALLRVWQLSVMTVRLKVRVTVVANAGKAAFWVAFGGVRRHGERVGSGAWRQPPNLLTQLAEWTRLGFLSKTGRGRYALPGPARPAGTATDSAGP
jgi:hypothetical protein